MRSFERFLRDTKGAVTIEFVTLFPAFIVLMVLFADTSVVYLTHTEMYNASRDIARRMSTHQLTTDSEVVAYAAEHLNLGARRYIVDPDFGEGNMKVTIAVPVSQAVFFGAVFGPILGDFLTATATVQTEKVLKAVNS